MREEQIERLNKRIEGREKLEIIIASGHFYTRFANEGYNGLKTAKFASPMCLTCSGSVPAPELYDLLERMTVVNYNASNKVLKSKSSGMAEMVSNAMLFDGSSYEPLGGITTHLNFKDSTAFESEEMEILEFILMNSQFVKQHINSNGISVLTDGSEDLDIGANNPTK